MYAVELRFDLTGHGIAPSQEVLAASVRANARRASAPVEHIRINMASGNLQIVAFLMAAGPGEARRVARTLGQAMTEEIPQVHLRDFRVWQDPRITGEGQLP